MRHTFGVEVAPGKINPLLTLAIIVALDLMKGRRGQDSKAAQCVARAAAKPVARAAGDSRRTQARGDGLGATDRATAYTRCHR